MCLTANSTVNQEKAINALQAAQQRAQANMVAGQGSCQAFNHDDEHLLVHRRTTQRPSAMLIWRVSAKWIWSITALKWKSFSAGLAINGLRRLSYSSSSCCGWLSLGFRKQELED